MRIRAILTAAAVAAGLMAATPGGAAAEGVDRVTSVTMDGGALWGVAGKCIGDGQGAWVSLSAKLAGPTVDVLGDDGYFPTGSVKYSVLSGKKVLATLTSNSAYGSTYGGAGTLYIETSSCQQLGKLVTAGVGRKKAKYTVRLDTASITTEDNVKHAFATSAASDTFTVRQLVKGVGTSRKASGKNYVWKGKIQLWKKVGKKYKWAAAPKGVKVHYAGVGDLCKYKSVKTASKGKFTFKLKKSVGSQARVYTNSYDGFGAQFGVKKGKVKYVRAYGGC